MQKIAEFPNNGITKFYRASCQYVALRWRIFNVILPKFDRFSAESENVAAVNKGVRQEAFLEIGSAECAFFQRTQPRSAGGRSPPGPAPDPPRASPGARGDDRDRRGLDRGGKREGAEAAVQHAVEMVV